MSNERPIIAVRFHTGIGLVGFNPQIEWREDRPAPGTRPGQIKARMGNPDLGEQRTSVVLEIRMGNKGGAIGDVDVEVPASNLAEVQRLPPEQKPAGAKK